MTLESNRSTPSSSESVNLDFSHWPSFELGPFEGHDCGPVRVKVLLDGEIIHQVFFEHGYLHRGIEKSMERQNWRSVIPYVDRVDPEASVFYETVFCQAVEEISQIEVPFRAQQIRILLCELNRINVYLRYLSKIAKALHAEVAMNYILRDSEKILDAFELLTGSRFAFNFLRIGGVVEDVTEGFVERVSELAAMIRLRLGEYRSLLTDNYAFQKRTQNIGILTRRAALIHGVTGPNGRACGVDRDLRTEQAAKIYQKFGFQRAVFEQDHCDIFDRVQIRILEIQCSLDLVENLSNLLDDGPHQAPDSIAQTPPPGEAFVSLEAPSGILKCHLTSDGSNKPWRIHFNDASISSLQSAPSILKGNYFEDLILIFNSLGISMAGVDK